LKKLVCAVLGTLALCAEPLSAAVLDLETATILDLQKAYDAGLPSEKVVAAYLKRIETYDKAGPKINAIITIQPKALEIAHALDAERKAKGPALAAARRAHPGER
jgi:amidase